MASRRTQKRSNFRLRRKLQCVLHLDTQVANRAFQVTLQHSDIANLTPTDISLQFGPAALTEKIGTWKDVYGIVERYRGKLLGADGKAWLVEVLDEWRWSDETAGAEGKAPDAYLRDVSRHTEKSPYANANFLKNSFLQDCKTVGLFEPVVKGGAAP